jgi:hypothetical protein
MARKVISGEWGKVEVEKNLWNIYRFFTYHSNKNANIANALYSCSTDIYQIQFCYLTSSVNIDIALTFITDFCLFYHSWMFPPGMLLVIMVENAPAPAVRLSIKMVPAKIPESLNRPLLHYCHGSNIHPETAGKKTFSNTHFRRNEDQTCTLVFLIAVSTVPYPVP